MDPTIAIRHVVAAFSPRLGADNSNIIRFRTRAEARDYMLTNGPTFASRRHPVLLTFIIHSAALRSGSASQLSAPGSIRRRHQRELKKGTLSEWHLHLYACSIPQNEKSSLKLQHRLQS